MNVTLRRRVAAGLVLLAFSAALGGTATIASQAAQPGNVAFPAKIALPVKITASLGVIDDGNESHHASVNFSGNDSRRVTLKALLPGVEKPVTGAFQFNVR